MSDGSGVPVASSLGWTLGEAGGADGVASEVPQAAAISATAIAVAHRETAGRGTLETHARAGFTR